MSQSNVGAEARETARTASKLMGNMRDAAEQAARVPGVGEDLRQPFDAASDTLTNLIASANEQVASIERLALISGWVVFGIPVAMVLALWLPRRVRFTLPAPQLSAMSVIVFGGPITLGALASAEQVRPPTITKLVAALEEQGLVERETDPEDRRVVRVKATARGTKLLYEGRRRRVASLAESLGGLPAADRAALSAAIPILEKVARAP